MNKYLGDTKAILFFIMPALLLFAAVVAMSVVASGYFSLLEWDGIGGAKFVGVRNYIEIFTNTNHRFVASLKHTFIIVLMFSAILLPASIVLAVLVADAKRGEKLFRTAFFIPVVIMSAVAGQLWLKIYDPNHGLINQVLELVGLASWSRNWLVEQNTVMYAVTIPLIWRWVGYYMLLLYAAIKGIPSDINESAIIGGAGKIRIMFAITMPLIMPMIKIVVVFMLVTSVRAFDLIYVLTEGGPMGASEVPAISMYNKTFLEYRYGLGSSMVVVIVVSCILYSRVVNLLFKRFEDVSY